MNTAQTGYYSVIQFCPDRSRMEVANIGVLLYVESQPFLKVRLIRENEHIKRFFAKDYRQKLKTVNATKQMLQRRIEVEAHELSGKRDVEQFLARFANDIVFTPLRPARVEDPEVELIQLFADLVEPRIHREPAAEKLPTLPQVRTRFEAPDIAGKLHRNLTVRVPILNDEVNVDYGFQNGRFNLIKIQEFHQKRSDALYTKAYTTAAEGRMIFMHPDQERKKQQLVLVAGFSEKAQKYIEPMKQLMEDHNVEFYLERDVEKLANVIRATAH